MPELPEVETIKTQLNRHFPAKILAVESSKFLSSILHTKLDLNNKSIITLNRKGKMLHFILSDDQALLSHLGMTGAWIITPTKNTQKHTHLSIQLMSEKNPNAFYLSYVDPRRFGHLYYLSTQKAQTKLNETGPDLTELAKDLKAITTAITKHPDRALKVTLLDQKLFAGSGNYIANEICARAGILPTRKCGEIKSREFKKIQTAIITVLDQAINAGGTTFQGGYQDTTGNKGKGVSNLVVFYQKICQLCKTNPVTKITLAQRGTYFCQKCQK